MQIIGWDETMFLKLSFVISTVVFATGLQAAQYFCEEKHSVGIPFGVDEFPSDRAILKINETTVMWDEMEKSKGYDPSADYYKIFEYFGVNDWIAVDYSESVRAFDVISMNPTQLSVAITSNAQGLLTSTSKWMCTEL